MEIAPVLGLLVLALILFAMGISSTKADSPAVMNGCHADGRVTGTIAAWLLA